MRSSTGRDKNIRTNRRARSLKPDPDHNNHILHHHLHHHHHINANTPERSMVSQSMIESGQMPLNYQPSLNNSAHISNTSNTNIQSRHPMCDDRMSYCSEEQLEDLLLKNLDLLYNEAISQLVGLGYDEEFVLKAILRNGYCYGGMDVLTNILHNSKAFLDSGNSLGPEESQLGFSDLRQLEEYSLAGMICLLQQVKPHISNGEAMWSLLANDLNVARASAMDFSVHPLPSGSIEGAGNGGAGVGAVPLCRAHAECGFGNGGTSEFPMNGFFSCASEMTLQKEIEFPKRFTLSPSMKSLLKRNVAAFAAGFRANSKQLQNPSQGSFSGQALSTGTGVEGHVVPSEELQDPKNQDSVNSVLLSKFRDLNLEESVVQGSLDKKDEMILTVLHQIKDLERQVNERKEWAHQKAMQAARKLASDLTELKTLRMGKDETQHLQGGKPALDETTMRKLQDMELNLRQASAKVDRANTSVRKLENENAEIKAEMQACKLSASESVNTCLGVAKREKKYLKRLLAWEKQKGKLQEDIADLKQRISDMKQQMVQVDAAIKETEVKWKQSQKTNEQALAEVAEERHLKEAAEGESKRRLESMRQKIEIDFQRHKDDLQRLEQELSRLQASAQSTDEHQVYNFTEHSRDDSVASLLNEFENKSITSYDRECVICLKDEASVVLLPCAHQVLCASCNENYGKKGRVICPTCRVPVEQRICIFGASP